MDWTRIIYDLEKSGLTQTEIARECGCTQGFISELRNGVKGHRGVGYGIGAALVALWQERCATKRRPHPPKASGAVARRAA